LIGQFEPVHQIKYTNENTVVSTVNPTFPLWLTIGCAIFALVVGAGSGLLPARQASQLRPVDALRYE